MNDFKNTNYSHFFEQSMIRRSRIHKSHTLQSKLFNDPFTLTKSLIEDYGLNVNEIDKYVTQATQSI
jgi:hypothetical protein